MQGVLQAVLPTVLNMTLDFNLHIPLDDLALDPDLALPFDGVAYSAVAALATGAPAVEATRGR